MKTTGSLSISTVKSVSLTCFLVIRLTSSIDSANLNQNELTMVISLRIDKLLLHWQFNMNVVSVADYNRYEAMTLSCCCGIAIHLSRIVLLVLSLLFITIISIITIIIIYYFITIIYYY